MSDVLNLQDAPILVIGAGIMGAGIAQVAAQSGHRVMLFDARKGAGAQAKDKVATTLQGLAAKGRMTSEAARETVARVVPVASLAEAREAGVAIEAIVENLEVKRSLLRELEAGMDERCVLASNTSSISITALANGLAHPGRLVGMHFFNPVPLMKLVEVVSGLHTDPAVAHAIFDLAKRWGKVPVHARSTPGFIVNRIARPFYAETLALLNERAGEPSVIDACMRGAGFRMGPCELMDLIGHDTNFAVTQSVYDANFGDKRYSPSLVQRELVEGGWLGRKSGRGFYRYDAGSGPEIASADVSAAALPSATRIVLHGDGVAGERWASALSAAGRGFERASRPTWCGLEADGGQLRLTDGRPAALIAVRENARELALFDLPAATGGGAQGTALAWTASATASVEWQQKTAAWLAAAGWTPQRVVDTPGLVVARTIAMLINEACDAVLQGVCDPEAADAAMKLGVNYPQGPFEWLANWDACEVVRVLDHLDNHYRGERYRVSLDLRRRAWEQEGRSTRSR